MTGPPRGCLAPATVGGIKVIMAGQCIFSRRRARPLALATQTMAYALARAGNVPAKFAVEPVRRAAGATHIHQTAVIRRR
jgi:hypothetical protein